MLTTRPIERMMSEMANPFREFDRYFDFSKWPRFKKELAIDVHEQENEIIIQVDMPGISKEDIKVSLDSGTLTIQGERKQEKEEKNGYGYLTEREFGSFVRSVKIPNGINEDSINATLRNGVLQLIIKKSEKIKNREVKIS